MARKLETRYTFTPGAAGAGTVVIDALYKLSEILMITNVTDNIVIYNFSDTSRGGVLTQTVSSTAPTTTITLDFDTSSMSAGDVLQIYVEQHQVVFKPEERFIDPVSKFRVSQPNTLIDTDFEYGLQATKWETLELVNNIPGFFSRTGDTPLNISGITAVNGSTTLTVTAPGHGLTVGTPIDVRGLRQATLEGSYLVGTVPDNDTFTFTARVTSTITGTVSGSYTTLTPGKFYAGSDIAYATIETDGATPSNITVTTTYNPGFVANTEFYLVNTLGSTETSFDSTTAVNFTDSDFISATFDPNGGGSAFTSASRVVDPWDSLSTFNTRYFYGGTANVGARSITITSHGFAGNNVPVALIPGPNSTVPTGLIANAGYIVKTIDVNTISLSSNVGGVDHALTAASGSGIIGLYQGWLVTATNATNDQLTLAGPTTFFNNTANITSSTQMLWFTSNATSGIQAATGSIFAKSVPGQLYDGTSGTILYWRGTTGQNVISTTAAGGGANIDITGATVSNNTVIVPITTNSNGNSLFIPNHGFLNNEPYLYYSGGGTAIGGLTTNTTYFIDFISSTQFGLKPTVGGARINLTTYGATGTTHSLSYSRPRANANTISISSHGFTDGAVVVYDANGGSAIGGLVDDSTYFVRDATTDSFRLAENSGGAPIDFTSAGTGTQKFTQAATGTFDGTYLVSNVASSTQFKLTSAFTVPFVTKTFANTDVFTGNSTVLITDHRFGTGSNVLYSNGGGTTIGGLTSGTYYFIYRQNKDRIRLAANLAAALAGTPLLTLTSAGTGSAHAFTFRGLAGENKGIGNITVNSGNTTITGNGTAFLRTYKSGDTLIINNTTDVVVRTINYVASDTKLVANSDPGISGVGLSYLVPTSLYIKSGAFTLHRPFDGGVEINAGYRADTQIVRQTRRYFRYQSGKGMQSSFAINFNPPIDIQELSSVGTTATAVTRKVHGLRVDQQFKVRDAEVQSGVNYYNGTFSVVSVPTETSFTYTLAGSPSVATAEGFPALIVTDWGGSKMRAGMYDFQNGMFFEFDGTNLYCVRRNSTQQLAGTVSVAYRSNTVTGTGSAFLRQLEVGDNVVIRGGTYKITEIASNSNMTIQPSYRGSTSDEVIISKTVDTRVAQTNWSLDACDGHGPSRYVLDTTRIQMVYMDYSWYGAGKVRYGFKGVDGEVFYCHEFKHNNRENEAYLRSGNLPARYEILNVGAPLFAPSLAHWGTSIIMDGTFEDDNAYLFTAPSKFLTFSGASATVTGETGGTYVYVNSDGTTGNNISTSANLTFATQSPAGGANAAVNTTSETITFNFNHGLVTGQLVRYQHVGGTIIGGLNNAQYYYAIRLTNQVIRLANSPALAQANSAVNLTSTPTGTHVFVNNFTFVPTKTTVPGYGARIIHRFITTGTGFAAIGNVPFGTPITASSISGRGTAYVYRVQAATTPSGGAIVDFFFADAVVDPATTSANGPLGTTGFLAAGTSQAIVHTLGSSASIPSSIPLISVRLAPSVDSSLTGALGVRDVINRMQQTLKSVGASTTHDIELRLVLNAQLDNNTWVSQGVPSLCQLVLHNDGDTVSGGINVFNFRATGNSPSSSGLRTANTFSADISSILALGNAILGGDGVYPDGPDILSLVAVPLSTSGITVNSPFSVAGRITWSESQA